jgi:predicted glutamine amidotransferase
MCRLLLSMNRYIDKETLINFFNQSNHIKNTPGLSNNFDSNFHLDGYGLAWIDSKYNLCIYKCANTYYEDINFTNILTELTTTPFIIGHLRNKGKNSYANKNINNCHPFVYDNYIFVHNGFIKNFKLHKQKIHKLIHPKYIIKIQGETDTEYLFYYLLTLINMITNENINEKYIISNENINEKYIISNENINEKYKMANVYTHAFEILIKVFDNENIEFIGNFIFSDSDLVLVYRFISKNFNNINIFDKLYSFLFTQTLEPPSLYYSNIDLKLDNILITSEPVNSNYNLIEQNKFFIYKINKNNIYSS